jgi:hypothetical protein
MVDQRRWWMRVERIVERSMNVRSDSLELVVRLVELDVAVAVGAVAVAEVVGFDTNEVAAVVDIDGRIGYPFDTQ